MYWEGDGSGITMEFYFEDGRYLRFYEFPVTVYYDPGDVTEGANVWAYAFENALRELNQVVQIEATDDRENANIIISVVPPEQLATACVIREVGVLAGCASMGRIGGATKPFVRGLAFVATDSHNPVGVVLHELLHALGVVVHSPDPDDIMYFEETQIKKLSARDLNTLRRLYDSPSYGD
jgi:predicted Zn-dependent protease